MTIDVEFIEDDKSSLHVLKEPLQAEGCGHRFCKTCMILLNKRSVSKVEASNIFYHWSRACQQSEDCSGLWFVNLARM